MTFKTTEQLEAYPDYPIHRDWRDRPFFNAPVKGGFESHHFQGRDEEVKKLKDLFMTGAGGGTVLLSGHRGVGKTATVDEALIQATKDIHGDEADEDQSGNMLVTFFQRFARSFRQNKSSSIGTDKDKTEGRKGINKKRTSERANKNYKTDPNLAKPDVILRALRPMDLVVLKIDYGTIASNGESRSSKQENNTDSADHPENNGNTKAQVPPKKVESEVKLNNGDAPKNQSQEDIEFRPGFVNPREVLTQIIKRLYEHFVVESEDSFHGSKVKYDRDMDSQSIQTYKLIKSWDWWEPRLKSAKRKFYIAHGFLPGFFRSRILALHFKKSLDEKLSQAMFRSINPNLKESYNYGDEKETRRQSRIRIEIPLLWIFFIVIVVGLSLDLAGVVGEALSQGIQIAGGLGIFGTLTGSFLSYTVTKRTRRFDAVRVAYSVDSSAASLQRDLEEVFKFLEHPEAPRQFRVVVVLDELDKISDERMLDGIVESFKNLFTLNKAVFVFITDKQYYDYLERIQLANTQKRTYAKHHTFFTHKVFLAKPDFTELRGYLNKINSQLNPISPPAQTYPEDSEIAQQWDEVVRFLMFESRSHFFDMIRLISQFIDIGTDEDLILALKREKVRPVQVRCKAYYQEMIEFVYDQERFRDEQRENLNNELLAQLFSVFDTRDQDSFTVMDVMLQESETLSAADLEWLKIATRLLIRLLQRCDAIRLKSVGNGKKDVENNSGNGNVQGFNGNNQREDEPDTDSETQALENSSNGTQNEQSQEEFDERVYDWQPEWLCKKPEKEWLGRPPEEETLLVSARDFLKQFNGVLGEIAPEETKLLEDTNTFLQNIENITSESGDEDETPRPGLAASSTQ